MRRVISRDVSRTVASRRRTLELLGVRLDLRAIGSRASGEAAKERTFSSIFDVLRKHHEDRALHVLKA